MKLHKNVRINATVKWEGLVVTYCIKPETDASKNGDSPWSRPHHEFKKSRLPSWAVSSSQSSLDVLIKKWPRACPWGYDQGSSFAILEQFKMHWLRRKWRSIPDHSVIEIMIGRLGWRRRWRYQGSFARRVAFLFPNFPCSKADESYATGDFPYRFILSIWKDKKNVQNRSLSPLTFCSHLFIPVVCKMYFWPFALDEFKLGPGTFECPALISMFDVKRWDRCTRAYCLLRLEFIYDFAALQECQQKILTKKKKNWLLQAQTIATVSGDFKMSWMPAIWSWLPIQG